MRRLATVLLVLLVLPLSARADDASKRASIHDLFEVMHIDSTMQTLMQTVKSSVIPMTRQMIGPTVPDTLKAQVSDLQDQLFVLIEQEMGWKTMEPAYIEIYARNFTEEQIDDLIAFYKTPTGQVMLAKTPDIARESMQAGIAKMTTLQPEIRRLIQDFAAQHAEEIKRARAMQKSPSE